MEQARNYYWSLAEEYGKSLEDPVCNKRFLTNLRQQLAQAFHDALVLGWTLEDLEQEKEANNNGDW